MAKKKYSAYISVEDYRNDMSRDRYSATTVLFELLKKVRNILTLFFHFCFGLLMRLTLPYISSYFIGKRKTRHIGNKVSQTSLFKYH